MKYVIILFFIVMGVSPALAFAPEYVNDTTADNPVSIKEYAKSLVGTEWESFNTIIIKESNWNYQAQNPSSSAYGLCQTMMSIYEDDLPVTFRENPYQQIDWCVDYISKRYGTPSEALVFHSANNYF